MHTQDGLVLLFSTSHGLWAMVFGLCCLDQDPGLGLGSGLVLSSWCILYVDWGCRSWTMTRASVLVMVSCCRAAMVLLWCCYCMKHGIHHGALYTVVLTTHSYSTWSIAGYTQRRPCIVVHVALSIPGPIVEDRAGSQMGIWGTMGYHPGGGYLGSWGSMLGRGIIVDCRRGW